MTVKELKEILSTFEDTLDVEILEPYDNPIWIDVTSVELDKRPITKFTVKRVRIS